MRHLILMLACLLVPVACGSTGCAKGGDLAAGGQGDPVLTAVAGLQGLAIAAMATRDSSASPAVCTASAVTAAALPPIASAVLDVHTDQALDEIPAVAWSVATCVDVDPGEVDPDSAEAQALEYVSSALSILEVLGHSLQDQVGDDACRPYAVALAGVDYAQQVPMAVGLVLAGHLDGDLDARAVDYSACDG